MRVVIGLGGNLGDRIANLRAACAGISQIKGVSVIAASRVYETAPVGPPQPDYLNAALLVECTLSLAVLLTHLLDVEKSLGRERRERWGPRTIDLDILFAEDATITSDALTVPHPSLRDRAFALAPLLDVLPNARDPNSREPYATLFSTPTPTPTPTSSSTSNSTPIRVTELSLLPKT